MTTELFYLTWAVVLGMVHVMVGAQATTMQFGMSYGLSSRDEKKEPTGIGGRIQRAFANYMQTFPFFAAAVLIAHVLNRHSPATIWGVQLYFWARLAFPFLYAFNVIGVRTVAFLVSMLGIALVLYGLT